MNRKRTLLIICLTLFVILILGVLLTYIIYINRYNEPLDVLSDYLINITSLVIAFIALIIALITYFSIDSVNNVTAMEGNVLDNPNYTIAYSEMVMDFKDCKNQSEFQTLLCEKVFTGLKHSTSTCIQFADCIQRVIDYIIWFAYLDFQDKELMKQCDKLIRRLDRELQRYTSLSNGIQYLLNENVKLIKYIFEYQKGRNLNRSNICKLENIRGKMIQNPISQIIYYDYLGLDYRKKASEILRRCGSNDPEFSTKYMRAVMEYKYCTNDIKHVALLLMRAKECFHIAGQIAETDLLWQGYIEYNLSRTSVMEYLINPTNGANISNNINDVVNIREMVCFFFQQNEDAYLNSRFELEYKSAVNLLNEFSNLLKSESFGGIK